MAVAQNIADQNTEYVRRLLMLKQPAFAVALELAAALVEQELLFAEGATQQVAPGAS
jgi:hypothetical protein